MDQQYTTALTAAISNFSPQHSLHTDEDFTRFYVQRPLAFIAELGEQIRQATPETKFLVYGHRGCGKTSELNRLARDLEDTHFTVILSLENENDPNDLHYTELLTSLCRSLLYSARERKLDVSERLLKDVEAWFATVEDISERKFSAEGATTEKVGLYFLELFSRQSAEFNKRQERRAKRQQHEGQLFALINRFITEIMQVDTARRGGSPRRLFAVVDSLDRYTPEIAREIFKYAPALQAPAMNIVYTVPLALTQDTAASNLLQDFGNFDCTIPIVTLFALDGARDEVAWTIAHEIIGKRCGGVRLPHDIDELLIEGSGGVLSILCWLFYNVYSLLLAREIAADDVAATRRVANQVLTQQRERFKRGLLEADYEVLNQRLPSAFPKRDARFQQLLYANCVLQYHNDSGESWYDMHPLVRDLVERWRQVRAEDKA